MKIKQLFEMLTQEQRIELAEEIRALLEFKEPEPKLTPISEFLNARFSCNWNPGSESLIEIASVRLVTSLKKHAEYCDMMGWHYETIRAKDLKRIRGIGNITINEFIELRDNYQIIK